MSSQHSSSDRPSRAAIELVAEREGVDQSALNPPLGDVIDPEALDTLVRSVSTADHPDAPLVRFTYSGYDVAVYADGTIHVTETSSTPSARKR